jgi:aminopeptidase 2
MENWGLITGRTNAFLLDPKKADLQAKKWVATVQSHEVAHMWYVFHSVTGSYIVLILSCRFGNITTMEWWDYLYLNEGVHLSHIQSPNIDVSPFRICYSGLTLQISL